MLQLYMICVDMYSKYVNINILIILVEGIIYASIWYVLLYIFAYYCIDLDN